MPDRGGLRGALKGAGQRGVRGWTACPGPPARQSRMVAAAARWMRCASRASRRAPLSAMSPTRSSSAPLNARERHDPQGAAPLKRAWRANPHMRALPCRRVASPTAPAWRFGAERMRIDERFGFLRVAGEEARSRFGLGPGMRVLDVGCGSGALTRFLLPALQGRGEVVGVDLDEGLLALAREETRGGGVRVRFERGDALELPFEDRSFDAVASQFLLCVLPEPLRALREMMRVARPGATIASISCFCKSGGLPRFHGLDDWPDHARFEELDARFRDVYRTRVRNPGLGLPNGRDLAVWGSYAQAGLQALRIAGYLPAFAPASADWSDADAQEYLERRERVDLGLLDGLSEPALATLAAHGLGRAEVRELRALTAEHYKRLRARGLRGSMDAMVDPLVLITGRLPAA